MASLSRKLKCTHHQKTEARMNFVERLERDVSVYILSFLDDPADLVRVAAVSHVWRRFVIKNGLTKQLCFKTCPLLSCIVRVEDATPGTVIDTSSPVEWEVLEREHWVYASLLQAIIKPKLSPKNCIANVFSASSTDHYPDECIVNTLAPVNRVLRRNTYWSSKGQTDPKAPESLTYKIQAGIWLITEIDIQPFKAFIEPGQPVFSAKSVRFKIGHPKFPRVAGSGLQRMPWVYGDEDTIAWTYTSPEFPMAQEYTLQPFKLPEPVLCIGGYLQIELLGRVQRQEVDGLFYICVCYVRILGRPLSPSFDTEFLEPDGKMLLKYCPKYLKRVLQLDSSGGEIPLRSREEEEEMLDKGIGRLEKLLSRFRKPENANPWGDGDEDYEDDDDEDEGDDEGEGDDEEDGDEDEAEAEDV